MNNDPIVIVNAFRTPMGSMQGELSKLSANELGAITLKKNIEDSKLNNKDIDEVIMGCVLPAGQGQSPARQASIKAGISNNVGATNINKMCGSGLKSVMLAYDSIISGTNKIVLAGGMESMTNAPYLLEKARGGYRLGHGKLYDHMFLDGLEDAYNKGKLMGAFAENTAEKFEISREQQDEFAISSLNKAKTATQNGWFADEISSITLTTKTGEVIISEDEVPKKAKIEKIPKLRAAFKDNGTVTAANSSSISDGASSLLLMKESEAKSKGLKPLAKIISHSTYAHEPEWFTTAPIGSIKKLLAQTNWNLNDVDLFEINEAFAVVTIATIKELDLDPNKVNINGGACALGHPIGASGARILTTLVHSLTRNNLSKGIASLCIGGGEAVAIAIERCI